MDFLNEETRALFEKSTLLFAQVNTRKGYFIHRENDTLTKKKDLQKRDLDNMNKVICELMK